MSDAITLIAQLELYDEAYENGDSIIPDTQYDLMKLEAAKLAPNHPYFMKVGSDARGGKIKLPFTMGSLDQIYDGDYIKWVRKFDLAQSMIVISHKLDGVSCMLQYKNGELQIAYSRGNGVMGADITRHVKKIPNVPKSIRKHLPDGGHLTVRGELIMRDPIFDKHWANDFKNPRNMVAGIFNRTKTDDAAIQHVDFIAYQIVDGSDSYIHNNQIAELNSLKNLGFQTVETVQVNASNLNDDKLKSILADCRSVSEYALDGIVLTINQKENHKNLSKSSSLNPEHSVKFKVLDENSLVTSTVVKVHWEISKNGYFKPRVEILPVQLFGTTVTYATGFNGKYIVDNSIGPGTTIKITKSGSVIPYIVSIIKGTVADIPTDHWDWNENEVEMVVHDAQNHPEVVFKQVLDFFNTLEVDLLKEASIEKAMSFLKLKNSSYEEILEIMLNLLEMEWEKIIGSNGTKIYASLDRRLSSLTLAKYLGALKYFGTGFGVRKAKLLLKNLTDENTVWNLSVNDVVDFEGFDVKTAQRFIGGLHDAKAFADKLGLKFIQEKKTNELEHLNVVFTGFRDKEFQEKLEKGGAKVGSSVSKKTTHLITAEPNSTSGKAIKAREIGIETLSLDEFKDKYNL